MTLTLNKKEINPRIARWALELQNYDYSLEHRSGKRMQHVDALNRNTTIFVLEANSFDENLIICQGKDEKLVQVRSELETSESSLYEMRNGVDYRKTQDDKLLFYVPDSMVDRVIYKYHDEMGHVGIDKTVDLIAKTYWFPKMREKVSYSKLFEVYCVFGKER